jgi:protein-S-isoprenylcysteine O-methyltransferase Ste14
MPVAALALYAAYLGLTFGLRTLIQVRRTGSTGFHGIGGRPGSLEWLAGVGFTLGVALGAAAPLLDLLGVVEPLAALDLTALHVAGLALAMTGIVATFVAQVAMGTSWRVGVDPEETTSLVTGGPFAVVRNPIFAAMLPAALGLALFVPSWVALVGLAGLSLAIEVQVRCVEEPHLRRAHGGAYAAYASRVGRFLPGFGRLTDAENAAGSAFQSR